MSTIVGIFIALCGLAVVAIGVAFVRFPGLCAPGESHVVCIRTWIGAVGPILAAIALLVAFGQFYLARDTASRQLRAYVGVVPAFGEKDPNAIRLLIDNQGQTPAYKLTAHLNWYWTSYGESLPKDFKYLDYHSSPAKSVAILQSKKETTFTIPFDVTRIQKARAKEIALFLYGHVDYVDAFDISRKTRFSYEYRPIFKDDKDVGHQLIMQAEHNDAD